MATFDVALQTEDGRRAAKIVDLTERGMRVHLDCELEPEQMVRMELRGRSYPARVIWNRDGRAGLEFDALLPLDALAAINRSFHRVRTQKKRRFLMPQ